MRLPQFRIRTLMICIAFLALMITVVYQTILLRRAAVREELYQAEAARHRAIGEQARAFAEAQNQQARAALDELSAKLGPLREKYERTAR